MSADLFDGQWRDVRDLVPPPAPTGRQPAAASDGKTARVAAKAEQRRVDRHDAVTLWGEKRAAVRAERSADRAEARARRDERRADRAAVRDRVRSAIVTLAQRTLVIGPILAPMAVAWTGQSQFAIQILGWKFTFSLLYAAAYELTTVYWAWLYHQARTDGDSGWEYRLATWVFAAGAAVQQWWHYSDHWNATPRAVTYSVMSAVGVLLWEGRARLLHRRSLRAARMLREARPRIGLVRWLRYPVRSWTAWSLMILENHRTLDEAWTAADRELADRRAKRTAARSARTAKRSAVRTERLDRKRRSGPDRTDLSGPGRKTITGPDHADRTTGPESGPGGPDRWTGERSGPLDRVVRTAGPESGPDRCGPPDRTGPMRTTGPDSWIGPDRTTGPGGPVQTGPQTADLGPEMQPTGPDGPVGPSEADRAEGATEVAPHHGPRSSDHADRTAGPAVTADRTEPDLVLTDVEQEAIEILRTTSRAVTKRNVAEVVRERGRSIASDRAARIARHYRSLYAA